MNNSSISELFMTLFDFFTTFVRKLAKKGTDNYH